MLLVGISNISDGLILIINSNRDMFESEKGFKYKNISDK